MKIFQNVPIILVMLCLLVNLHIDSCLTHFQVILILGRFVVFCGHIAILVKIIEY